MEDFWGTWKGLATMFAGAILFIAGGSALGIHLTVRGEESDCGRVGEATSTETKWVGSTFSGACYVKVDERWIPLGAWRVDE